MQCRTWALCLLFGLFDGALSIWTPTARGWRTGPIAAVSRRRSSRLRAFDTEGPDRVVTVDDLTVKWDRGVSWRSADEVAQVLEQYGVCRIRGVHDPAVIDALRDTVLQRYEECEAAIKKKGMKMTDGFAYNEICHEKKQSSLRYDLRLSTQLSETCLVQGKVCVCREPSRPNLHARPLAPPRCSLVTGAPGRMSALSRTNLVA